MTELPPKGCVSISDLKKMYNSISKNHMHSQGEDIIFTVWEDMVFSLENIKEWCSQGGCVDSDGDAGSIDKHLDELYHANTIGSMIIAIDNCLNDYHGVSIMIEYIINVSFDEANKFLDEIRDKKG